jgi:hypothetical protein
VIEETLGKYIVAVFVAHLTHFCDNIGRKTKTADMVGQQTSPTGDRKGLARVIDQVKKTFSLVRTIVPGLLGFECWG